eukprot:TRINITY_DN2141_c0_g1_i2.p1 TRINITY_DN2141_c0_g1~~TRINITY_DN2141_c0_g1_i2.p1  ORF type:complete len:547 (-),score=34.93 TRINITY_DN2141_c0_g1_i2:124-1764(-)
MHRNAVLVVFCLIIPLAVASHKRFLQDTQCVHDTMPNFEFSKTRFHEEGEEAVYRQSHRRQSFEGIRIRLEYDASFSSLPSAKRNFIQNSIESAVTTIESIVSTKRVTGNLKFDRNCAYSGDVAVNCNDPLVCGNLQLDPPIPEVTIPTKYMNEQEVCSQPGNPSSCETLPGGSGASFTDILIYVLAEDMRCTGTFAYAYGCVQDATIGRPILGVINYCENSIEVDTETDLTGISIHEILHVLGFSNNLYDNWRDDQGNVRSTVYENGGLVTPRVLAEAREHFDCPSLNVAELENLGDFPSSHWESLRFGNEIITAVGTAYPVFSRMTMAALEDTGWYQCDYSKAGHLEFGYRKGCSFLNTRNCATLASRFPLHFCDHTAENADSCSVNRKQVAGCLSRKYYDDCGIWEPYLDSKCDTVCDDCRCIGTRTGKFKDNCLPVTCDIEPVVEISTVGGNPSFTCTDQNEGSSFTLGSGTGAPVCPSYSSACLSDCPSGCSSCITPSTCSGMTGGSTSQSPSPSSSPQNSGSQSGGDGTSSSSGLRNWMC